MTFTDLRNQLLDFDVTLFTLGDTAFTVSSLLKLVVLLVLLFYAAARISGWTVKLLSTRSHLDPGTQASVASIVHYGVLLVGLALILQNAGIQLTAFAVVAGALGVGVGFGLQNIISNFISGLIIMFERPIKVGDRIQVGGNLEGVVREIGARRTTVVTNDRIAVLVPNQKFITDSVVNYLYLEDEIRLRVPVSVAAGTDPALVERLLVDVAAANPQVHRDPAPQVLLLSLGGSTMSFELVVWFDARAHTPQALQSALNFAIGQALQAQQIKTN